MNIYIYLYMYIYIYIDTYTGHQRKGGKKEGMAKMQEQQGRKQSSRARETLHGNFPM